MAAIRNWRDGSPRVAHGATLEWDVFREKGRAGYTEDEAPLEGMLGMVFHRIQAGQQGSYHVHEDREHICYFISGRGRMKMDGAVFPVREGDAVHVPPGTRHQVINDGDDEWLEHIIVSGPVRRG